MIVYKINILDALKEAGYTTTRVRKEKLLGENILQYLREGKPVGIGSIDKICKLLDMQPGDIIKYMEDKEE